jgi:hypothetical protein
MHRKTIPKIGATLAALGLCAGLSTSASATLVNLSTAGASAGTLNGATFSQQYLPAGTGNFDPFLTIQANGTEQGYNTPGVMDAKGGGSGNTKNINLSDLTYDVNHNVLFSLDINESNGGKPGEEDSFLILNRVILIASSTPNLSVDTLNGFLLSGTTIYDSGEGNGVQLNFDLAPGSGYSDMLMSVPLAKFSGLTGNPYIYLYSAFGDYGSLLHAGYSSSDGFEEWRSSAAGTPIPEPTTVVAGALLLLPFGVSTLRALRKRRT